MTIAKGVTFSWKNYTRATPANMESLATSLRRMISIVAGTTVIMEASWYIPFTVLMIGAVLDELKNFFAKAKHDYEETVSINIPESVQDKVNITHNETDNSDTTA